MKKAFAMILIILCLLSAAAPAETWTIAPIETPEGEPIGISPDGSTMLAGSPRLAASRTKPAAKDLLFA